MRFLLSIVVAAALTGCAVRAADEEAPTPSPQPADTMTEQPSIIYIGDPMCSWCYGIANEVAQLKSAWAGKAGFQLLMGGLRPNETTPIDAEMKAFLKHHWEEVNKRSGQPFSYDILERNDFVYNTEPASRAVVVARKHAPGKEFEFFKAVQKAFYLDNSDPHLVATYLPLCDEFGIDRAQFQKDWESDEMKYAVRQEFQQSGSMGVRSFPTVVLHHNNELTALAVGYSEFEVMNEVLEKLLVTADKP